MELLYASECHRPIARMCCLLFPDCPAAIAAPILKLCPLFNFEFRSAHSQEHFNWLEKNIVDTGAAPEKHNKGPGVSPRFLKIFHMAH